MRTRAFTLIELLIVVAIIAILAAIAVPNFLEAQTRAKVARVKADMRTIATAIESYRVDGNKYPPMSDKSLGDPPSMDYGSITVDPFHSRIPNFLTTPIAYTTSLGYDIFLPGSQFASTRYPLSTRVGFRYTYFNYPQFYEKSNDIQQSYRTQMTGGWLFYSFGPDKNGNFGTTNPLKGPNWAFTRYDPTNGTVSIGNIIRTAASPEGSIPYHPGVTGSTNGQN